MTPSQSGTLECGLLVELDLSSDSFFLVYAWRTVGIVIIQEWRQKIKQFINNFPIFSTIFRTVFELFSALFVEKTNFSNRFRTVFGVFSSKFQFSNRFRTVFCFFIRNYIFFNFLGIFPTFSSNLYTFHSNFNFSLVFGNFPYISHSFRIDSGQTLWNLNDFLQICGICKYIIDLVANFRGFL